MNKHNTIEMLDKLGLEDTATNQEGYHVGYDHKGNLLMWGPRDEKPTTDEDKFTIYYPWLKNDTWVITHYYVDYDTAISAFQYQEKTIVFHDEEGKQTRIKPKNTEENPLLALAEQGVGLMDLVKGKWTIEN